ncbi:MAG: alpha-hydroxy-acid oxidizing protein [Actinomycetota bacterium]|nr:alpha-hydroxy-acid oxidizing protein [Actinomycetota bacterium]
MTERIPIEELWNCADYEQAAEGLLQPGPLGYFAGGAADERTLRDNVAAFGRWQLRPRMLVDVSSPSAATTVMGSELSMPVLVAPVALQRLAHREGEAGMARAAAAAGTIMCLSTLATARPSEIAAATPNARNAPRWFQLYCFKDRAVSDALLDEAVEAGFEAIVLTVDTPWLGRRERDLRSGFQIPPEITIPGLTMATGSNEPASVAEILGLIDPSLSWRDLEELASKSKLPVLVKGILTAEDARLAIEHRAAGLIVSNHGGRQLDAAPASLDALPEVVEAADGRVEVLMDGGVRRGTDVVVALALGARAVLVGRPAVWGLAVDGEHGARRVLEMLRDEVTLALALCGCTTPADVAPAHVQRHPAVL